jgi:hypothetical protein
MLDCGGLGGDGDLLFLRFQTGALVGGNHVEGVVRGGLALAAEEGGKEAAAWFFLRIRLGLFGAAAFALGLALGLPLGALFAPVAPAILPGAEEEPAVRDVFLDGPEADCGGKAESGGGQHAGHQPGALDVEVGYQQAGDELAHHALGGQHVKPAPVPGEQREDGGQKGQGEQRAGPAQQGGAAGTGVHPGPADSGQPQRQEEGRDAEGLQQKIAGPRAEEAGPVAHGKAGGGVQRGIGGAIGGQRQEQEERDQQQHEPQKHVPGAAARGRQNDAN